MARLPQPGGDSGSWGDILNDYLSQALKANGQIKDNAVTANALAPNSVTNTALANDSVNASIIANDSITEVLLDGDLRTKLNAPPFIADGSVALTKLDDSIQTSLSKADSALQSAPVTTVNDKTGSVTITKSDVGLSNADNTSDVSKPISSAAQTAIDGKVSSIVSNNFLYGRGNGGVDTSLPFSSGTGSATIMYRTTGGVSSVNTPTAATHIANKQYVDDGLGTKVTGSASSTDNAITRYDGTTGKLVQDSNIFVTDTNRLGIGTQSPTALLHVSAGNADSVTISERSMTINAPTYQYPQFQLSNGVGSWKFQLNPSGYVDFRDVGTNLPVFSLYPGSNANRFVILSNNNVAFMNDGVGSMAIGHSGTPGAKLDVAGDVKVAGKIANVTNPTSAQDAATKNYVDTSMGSYVDLSNAQNVTGLKTFSGGITVGGQLTRTGAEVVSMATRTAAVTLTTSSPYINFADATTASFIVTLPATTTAGITFVIKKIDTGANTVSIASTSIDGNASIVLAKPNDFITVVSTTGSGTWKIVGGNVSIAAADPVSSQASWTGAVNLPNPSTPGVRKVQLTGNTTLTVPNGTANQSYSIMLDLVQDATGSRTLTFNGVKWGYGVAPTLSTTAGSRDVVTLWWSGSDWVGFVGAQGVI